MKKILMFIVAITLTMSWSVQAEVWNSGHHEINDGDSYGELDLANAATADMFGGHVIQLGAFDSSIFNMFDGTVESVLLRHNSTVNIYGGTLEVFGIYDDEFGEINLYAHDVIYHPTGGPVYNLAWVEGYYTQGNIYFVSDLGMHDMSHINIVPEPATILLLGLGGLILRRK